MKEEQTKVNTIEDPLGTFDASTWEYTTKGQEIEAAARASAHRSTSPFSLYRTEPRRRRRQTPPKSSESDLRPISREAKYDLLSQPVNTPKSRLDLIRKKHEEKEARRRFVEKNKQIEKEEEEKRSVPGTPALDARLSSSAMERKLYGRMPLPRTPEATIGKYRYAGSLGLGLASEIPSVDEPIDRLILHAVLRTHVPSYMEAEEGVTAEAAFEGYMMRTHSLVKVRHEQTAIAEAVPYIDLLKSKNLHTQISCRKRSRERRVVP